jgi:hypothetical protein
MRITSLLARLFSATLVAGALLLVTPADATSAVLLSRKELVGKSDLVVRATVVDAESAWNDDNTAIVTRTRLRVTRAAKGKAESELVVSQMGGTVGDKTMVVAGDAHLTPGQDVVVFLKRGEGGYVHLTALAQAAYSVKEGKARRDMSGLSLFIWLNGKLVPTTPPNEKTEPVDGLLGDVARLAKAGAK